MWAQVHSLIENVASMDEVDCNHMNSAFEDQPWYVDAGASVYLDAQGSIGFLGSCWRPKGVPSYGDQMGACQSRERFSWKHKWRSASTWSRVGSAPRPLSQRLLHRAPRQHHCGDPQD